jgi:diguanylate cyclase
LTDETTHALYHKHIADLDQESSQRISASVAKIVAEVSDSTAQAGDQASSFGGALERWSMAMTQPQNAVAASGALAEVLRDTHTMQGAIGALQARLEASRREAAELKDEVRRVRAESLVDALTGLSNRRAFDAAFRACLDEAQPGDAGPCLLMVDIDHFKRVNDSYGHLVGDKVLHAVGRALQANIKGKDTASRYGGEEFAVLLPQTPLAGAARLAETLRATVASGRVKSVGSGETFGNITISVGAACYRAGESPSEFIARADRALYAAKTRGRNRVCVAESDAQHEPA